MKQLFAALMLRLPVAWPAADIMSSPVLRCHLQAAVIFHILDISFGMQKDGWRQEQREAQAAKRAAEREQKKLEQKLAARARAAALTAESASAASSSGKVGFPPSESAIAAGARFLMEVHHVSIVPPISGVGAVLSVNELIASGCPMALHRQPCRV